MQRRGFYMNRNEKAVTAAFILSAALYAFSFTPAVSGRHKEKQIESALMNPKYENDVSEITITSGSHSVALERNNSGIWIGKSGNRTFPAEQKTVSNMIQRLIKIRSMYKISDNPRQYNDLGLSENDSVSIEYKINSNMSTIVYFGGQNYEQTRRYMRSQSSKTSYEIESDLDTYLTVSESFWADPYIIPRNMISDNDMKVQRVSLGNSTLTSGEEKNRELLEKITSLRHGELCDTAQGPVVSMLDAYSGDGTHIHADIRNISRENDMVFTYRIENSVTRQNDMIKYSAVVSSWTYGRLLDYFKK
jgi:hypothetical protein